MSTKKETFSKAEQRKMQQMRMKKRNRNMMLGILVIILIAIGATFLLWMGNPDDQSTFSPVSDSYEASETQISIPLSSITDEASFFKYESEGVDIHYFAVRDTDDEVHVALDACDLCYHDKEGYRQIGDVMECRNCGLTFPIKDIGEKNTGGGCWPSFIPYLIEDESVYIEKSDLEDKRFMFE